LRIKVYGAGGNAGQGMVRCLKESFDVVGHDDSLYARHLMECPEGDGELNIVVPSRMHLEWADRPDVFLPPKCQIAVAHDKYKTAKILGGMAPETYWVRDTHGSGGKGAQMCQEFLSGRNASVEAVFVQGSLIATFAKERVSYTTHGADLAIERRGTSMVSRCIKDDRLTTIAILAIECLADYTETEPHGFYGVDFLEDEWGCPKVTEINAGRLLTASYNYFANGYNLPVAGVKAFLGEPYLLGEYPEGLGIVRSYDRPPAFVEGLS
jgi:hypothetical protein